MHNLNEENTSISLDSKDGFKHGPNSENGSGMARPQQRRMSRRSSGVISFEVHDSLIFEELSTMIDEEEEQEGHAYPKETNDSGFLLNKEIIASTFHDSTSTGGFSGRGFNRCPSEISLVSILEDDDAAVITKIERNVIDREIRAGNSLVRSRSDASFANCGRFPRTGSAVSGLRSTTSASGFSRNGASSSYRSQHMPPSVSALQNKPFLSSSSPQVNESAASAGRALLGTPSASNETKRSSSKRSPRKL